MSDQLVNTLFITGLVLLAMVLWIVSILIVRWDVRRRNLRGFEQYIWPVVVALLPLFGVFAYLFARFALPDPAPPRPGKRTTEAKRPPETERRLPTIAASDMLPGTNSGWQASIAPTDNSRRMTGGWRLMTLEGPHTGKEFPLESLPARIGRGASSAIRLDEDLGVSRQHAEIFQQNGRLRIRDLNSTHGTHVNGLSIVEKDLEPGDRIQIGYSLLLVRWVEDRT